MQKVANVKKEIHSTTVKRDIDDILCSVRMAGLTHQFIRKRREERVVSLSGAMYLSGKEKLDQDIPIPRKMEQWANHSVEMQYNLPSSEDQKE